MEGRKVRDKFKRGGHFIPEGEEKLKGSQYIKNRPRENRGEVVEGVLKGDERRFSTVTRT